jgi:Xaa-Pro dipeptidase
MSFGNAGKARIARLQARMKEKGVAALLCLKPLTTFYLSGFNPIIHSHPVVVILTTDGEPTLLVHALRDDHARASAWTKDIRLFGSWSTKRTMSPSWLNAVREILKERGVIDGPLGIEEDYLSIARLKEIQGAVPNVKFVDISSLIKESRFVKDASEIEDLRKACKLADVGMAAAIDALHVGASEREISNASMAAMHKAWADNYPEVEVADVGHGEGGLLYGLWTYALFGDRVLLNCDNPTLRQAQNGEIALIVVLTCANCQKGENERAVAIGELPKEKRRAYDAILEVRARTCDLVRAGTPVRELFAAAKAEYQRLGYGANIPGRIGHGMGLGHHEYPSIDAETDFVLQPNMVITYEPNLRIAEWGGLQHSDTVLITETGHEFLTKTDNGFIQV